MNSTINSGKTDDLLPGLAKPGPKSSSGKVWTQRALRLEAIPYYRSTHRRKVEIASLRDSTTKFLFSWDPWGSVLELFLKSARNDRN